MSTICPASLPFCLGTLMIPRMRLRVVCGFGEIIASFSPTSAFSSVLLPALGRPSMQTNPEGKDMKYPQTPSYTLRDLLVWFLFDMADSFKRGFRLYKRRVRWNEAGLAVQWRR